MCIRDRSHFDFRNLHIENKEGKYIKTGIVDIQTSEIKFIVDSNDWYNICLLYTSRCV